MEASQLRLSSFELIAQKLVYGGDALGHHEGRPVLVPYVLPGERVEAEVVRVAKGVLHARPRRILEAAPERIAPPCPYYARCGGCHYQHLSAERQSEVKSGILRETLRRIGKISWEQPIPVLTAYPWGYRNQAQFKVRPTGEGGIVLGYFEAQSHRLLPVGKCPILSPRLNSVLAELNKPLWAMTLADCREVELLADDQDARVAITLKGDFPPRSGGALASRLLAEMPGVASVTVDAGRQRRVFGAPKLEYQVGDFRYRVSPGSFFQTSRFLLPDFVAAVTGVEPGGLALDLFAGVGLFTLPLARRFEQVIAVEAEPSTAADLKENAAAHSFVNVRSLTATACDFLRRFAQTGADLVVLDPPRAGVGAATLKLLVALRPQWVHCVSCSPPTLARDLGYLVAHGYQLHSVELFDFFPQTYHLESVTKLVR